MITILFGTYRAPDKRGIEDNPKIMYFSTKTYIVTHRDSSNYYYGSQNMFLWRNMANYPQIIPVTPSYLELCI